MNSKLLLSTQIFLLSALSLSSQTLTSNPQPVDEKKTDEITHLNVFQVVAADQDEYRAANTTTGTRYNTPVKNLPMDIEVITPAFMRDIGASNVRDVLEYVSGVQLDNTTSAGSSTGNPENSTLLIRGISAATKKDGFARFVPVDPITINQLDIIKGPGGALYGQNGTGGVVNVTSVTASSHPRVYASSTIGSFGLKREELSFTTPLPYLKNFGFALPLAYQDQKSTWMYYKISNFVMVPTLTANFGDKLRILASIESRFNQRNDFSTFFLSDTALNPNGAPYGTLIPGRPGNPVLTTPSQRDFRFDGPDTYRHERDYVTTYRVDYMFSENLQWWGGFSSEDIKVHEQGWNIALRNANDSSIPMSIRTDPRFLSLLRPAYGTAQPQLLDIRPNNITLSARTVRPTWKSELYYAFKLGSVSNRLITGISYGPLRSGNNAPNDNFYYGNTGSPNDAITKAWEALPASVILSRFRSPTDYSSVQHWNPSNINQFPQGPAAANGTNASYVTSLFWDRNLYANLQSSFFNDKISTIIGLFDTRNDRAGNVYDTAGNFLWNKAAPAGSPSGTPSGIRRPQPVRNTAPSATIIWMPNSNIRLYVNAMSALDPGPSYSGYDGNGVPLNAAQVTNSEAGIKLDVLNNKLLFNLAAFKMQDKDRPINYAGAIQNLVTAAGSGATLTSGFGSFVKTSTNSKGFDLKVDYIPVKNLRFNFGISENDAIVVAIDPFVTPNNPNPTYLAAQQQYVANGGSSSKYLGRPSNDISKYTGSGFIRYDVRSGILNNLWILLGAKYLGSRQAEIVAVSTSTGVATVTDWKVPSHSLFDMALGYRVKFGKYSTELKLNLQNLKDDETFYGANWQLGRTYKLSAIVRF
jgi:outer membrane receptor protein involved in Fe transport